MLLKNIVILYLLFMAILTVYWAVRVRTLNKSDYALPMLFLCIAVCFYIIGYAMELQSAGIADIIFWNHIEYIGIPFVSALWLTAALMYTGHFARYRKILLAAIYLIPVITMILRFTNTYHHLYFASTAFLQTADALIFVKTPGPWMHVQLFHSMAMILLAMGLFAYDAVKNDEKQTGKIFLVAAASVFAVTGLLFSMIRPFGLHIDYMACCLPIACVMVILAIARYDFLEAKSVARSKVFEANSDAILLVDRENRILDYNNSAKQLFENMGVRIECGHMPPELSGNIPALHKGITSSGTRVIELSEGPQEQYLEVSTTDLHDISSSRVQIKTIRNVTEIYQLNNKLHRYAMTDELSTLNNRRSFIKLGQQRLSEAPADADGSIYLIMLDLDHFKSVNDRHGHAAGDLVIQEFGHILKRHFDSDTLIARLGGEEFAILHTDCGDREILDKLNTLLENVEQYRFGYQSKQLNVTVSIGITKRQPGQDLSSMMRQADKALYDSKAQGRNRVTML